MDNVNNQIQNIETLKEGEIIGRLKDLNNWNLSQEKDEIIREIEIDSFDEVVVFIDRVADFFRKTDHYPHRIIVRGDKIEFRLKTPKVKGLTKRDFELAKEIDFIADWDADFQRWLSSTKVIIVLLVLFMLILFWRYFI